MQDIKIELRRTTQRAASSAPGRMSGYAALFDSPCQIGNYTEVIRAGAFSRALREKQDVRCLVNHDPNLVLGRTASGTLSLSEDARGLKFICDLPDTSAGRDVKELLQRGDLAQCSFAFVCKKDRWTTDAAEGTTTREILDVDLFDVSTVTYPAYDQTSASWQQNAASLSFAEYRSGKVIRATRALKSHDLERERLSLRVRLMQM